MVEVRADERGGNAENEDRKKICRRMGNWQRETGRNSELAHQALDEVDPAWPNADEQLAFDIRERRGLQGMIAILICLSAFDIWDAAVVIGHEYLYP